MSVLRMLTEWLVCVGVPDNGLSNNCSYKKLIMLKKQLFFDSNELHI